ncbi:dTDP-glucose 4,6-dehydratase [Candidatus Daviesbacteria bacterium RIFCSPHIGHO2_01_FULL_44_29]|uniref:dTDP-glucose 4,6-dehydratase n=1 Tax=Candidatus Daviesbacteria bacterium RIFCSPHIGHO2_02_FULL_43_12 TaxID=1797776 RepID=A0A1F5KKP5_9BACT|nr:MAG: dTDP-glucose 4,6-dehydratase [Candidatus Daviesbacteria bacterium RIFCSPHIGHO2_01_FULL_44_29]OGE41365.1 MAG: dTDP-glucose 4,6-dehydratase [Candidatus Daviesbacteria bacterium RIFCSPHIGHO2_02_FULL_43_12]OGE69566.1 MAG: dTDP-glucose 4,6-dehydratase [Candidatus Daviesbacteria bacterium RIFCSPLOWO2_01_FULL_43_15]
MRLLITGGAGFIGSNFVHYWLTNHPTDEVVVFDKLTYAGHLESLGDIKNNPHYSFIQGDIGSVEDVDKATEGIDLIVHFAAESHVDRSVIDPLLFVKTNVLGTANLLNVTKEKKISRFHHVSTDEVYGELRPEDPPFTEKSPFSPRSPYAASKAGSDHLVQAFFETYGLPVTISNCANNFGPYHDPEKLIPRFITNLLEGKKVPLMGQGAQSRSWLYVKDHSLAIDLIIQKGQLGETYCIGGEEKTNLETTKQILELMGLGIEMIEYVPERLGHDFRYALDSGKIASLGWRAEHDFSEWLKITIDWFKANEWWWKPLKEGRPIVDRVAQAKF